jgi:hypothetical protein
VSEKLGDDIEAISTCAAGNERGIANLLRETTWQVLMVV